MIAKSLVGPLTKLLIPLLRKGTAMAADAMSPEQRELAGKLWEAIKEAVEGSGAKETVEKYRAGKENEYTATMLEGQLLDLLEGNPALAAKVAALLDQAGGSRGDHAVNAGSGAIAQGAGAKAVGQGGVIVEGNVQGGIKFGK